MAAVTEKHTERTIPTCSDGTRLIAVCDYFSVKELSVDDIAGLECSEKSYQALVCVDGSLEFASGDDKEMLYAGETVFLPAGFGKYTLNGKGKVLITEN